MNNELLYMGIALSFSSFYDINRKHKLMDIIFRNPKVMKGYLVYAVLVTLLIFVLGIYSFFITEIKPLRELAVGIIVLGIGVLSLLKMSIEIAKMYSCEENNTR